MEEVTKTLVETGVLARTNGSFQLQRPLDDVVIPDTIQEVILSRIDRLHGQAREALQLASVIGREFTVRLLDRISDLEGRLDHVLGELKAIELIYEKHFFPELAYMFKHALTHDVAYSTLLERRRRALHRLVASAAEELYEDRLAEQYETLAHHYTQAEAWEKALEYLILAGDKARERYANEDARAYYARAAEVAERLGRLEDVAAAADRRGHVSMVVGGATDAIDDWNRALEAARKLGDRRLEGHVLSLRGYAEMWAHEFETARETLDQALRIADDGYDDVRYSALANLHALHWVLGDIDQALALEPDLERLTETVEDPFSAAWWLGVASIAQNWRGQFSQAFEVAKRMEPYAQAARHAHFTTGALWLNALLHGALGNYEEALDYCRRTAADCLRLGDAVTNPRNLNTVGWIYGELQLPERAAEWNRRGVDEALAAGFPDPECLANALLNLGDNHLALGRLDDAERCFQQVEEIVRHPKPGDRWLLWAYAQHHFHSAGELRLARGDTDGALAYAEECLRLAERTQRRKNVVKGRRLRAQALAARGELGAAEADLRYLLDVAAEIGNPPQLWKTWAALGELCRLQGRPDEAREAYRKAAEVIDAVAGRLRDPDLRAAFTTAPAVQAILQCAK